MVDKPLLLLCINFKKACEPADFSFIAFMECTGPLDNVERALVVCA